MNIMAYYYKINDCEDTLPPYKGFHLQKVKKYKISGPKINYDFSKHVLIELLDDTTSESELWYVLGLVNNKMVARKRMMLDSHRVKCRRAVVICINSDEAKQLAQSISQTKVMNRCVCAVVIQDLLSDLCLFEKQVIQYGDSRSQQQLLYVSDLSRTRGPSGLVKFLKETFSPFGAILSVLVCSYDDDYAFPEGVVKFAYLSEAFAAELAFDQYVVGKERLSVTTHHNILLSQCDLRMRLRDAQWHHNIECDESNQPSFHSYNGTYKLSDLSALNYDPVVDSMNQVFDYNHAVLVENNSKFDKSEDSFPHFSQLSFTKKNCDKNTSPEIHKKCSKRIESKSSILLTKENSVLISKICEVESDFLADTINCIDQEMGMFNSETIPFEMTTKKVNRSLEYLPHSRKRLNAEKLLHTDKSFGNRSDCDSFAESSCLDSKFNSLVLSSKKANFNSFHSYDNNTVSEYLSNHKQLSSAYTDNLNDSEADEESKYSKKRRKKFTPSQKLCLKSQRTGLIQNSILTTSANNEISDSGPSEQNKHTNKLTCRNNLNLPSATECLKTDSYDVTVSSKVSDWLLHLPTADTELSCEKEVSIHVENTFSKKLTEVNSQCKDRISIHRSSLKSNIISISEQEVLNFDNSSLDSGDPSKSSMISSDKNNPITLVDKSKSPLQTWLKQELMSSTNNSVIKSQDTSKSIIVCAARTKDVIISVGCSHMTCDFCYPESTDLLLGYS